MINGKLRKLMDCEDYIHIKKELLIQNRHIKNGPNVIHFEYLDTIFSEDDFTQYEQKLNEVSLTLSRREKGIVSFSNCEKFKLISYIIVEQSIMEDILDDHATSETWNTIKDLSISIWDKYQNRTYKKITSDQIEEREIPFGVRIVLDKNTSFNLRLKNDMDQSAIEQSLDLALNFIKEQERNESYKYSYLVHFDINSRVWIKTNVTEEIKKLIDKEKNRK